MYIGDAICDYLKTRSNDEYYNKIMEAILKYSLIDERGVNLKDIRMPTDKKIEFEYLVNGICHENIYSNFSEYPHLIALIQTHNYGINKRTYGKNGFYWNNLHEHYQTYFGNIFTDKEIEELMDLHMNLDNENMTYGIDDYSAKIDLIWLLENIKKDNDLLRKAKIIGNKANLNLKQSLHFIRLYHDSSLYLTLLHTNRILDEELIKKIKYLAVANKLEEKLTWTDFLSISYEQLKSRKTINFKVKNMLRGGPHSRSITNKEDNRCFNGQESSSEREVRGITSDGKGTIFSFDNGIRHEEGIEILYQNYPEVLRAYKQMITMNKSNAVARTIAFLAAAQINSITLIIEKNFCQIYIPETVTREQAETCIKWLENGQNGVFGICKCYANAGAIKILKNEEDGSAEFDWKKAIQLINESVEKSSNRNNGEHTHITRRSKL